MADLATSFRKPFKEQVAAFRLRLGNHVPTAKWDDLWKAQHDRAFMVAGAAKADLLADLAKAVEKSIAEGTSLEEFRRDFRQIVERRGWHGWTGEGTKKGEAWRTRIIYQTNMRTSYAAGRHAQLVEGGFKYWVYRHGGALEPREQHLAWDGLILPADHPFWATHYPPNGWGCSCYVVGARSLRQAIRLGGNPKVTLPEDWRDLNQKTGEPDGIDRGWGYAPGESIVQEVFAQMKGKAVNLPPKLADQFTRDIEEPVPPSLPTLNDVYTQVLGDAGKATDHVSALRNRVSQHVDASLTLDQKVAINVYTGHEYGAINAALRSAQEGAETSGYLALATLIDDALHQLPDYTQTVWRGVYAKPGTDLRNAFAGMRKGRVVEFRSFTSTSRTAEASFGGGIRLEIESATGKSIEHLSRHPNEQEVLFARGTRFRVLRKWTEKGTIHIRLREIRPGERPGPNPVALSLEFG